MKKTFLILELNRLEDESNLEGSDIEKIHLQVDHILLDYINDDQIREAFEAIVKGYG